MSVIIFPVLAFRVLCRPLISAPGLLFPALALPVFTLPAVAFAVFCWLPASGRVFLWYIATSCSCWWRFVSVIIYLRQLLTGLVIAGLDLTAGNPPCHVLTVFVWYRPRIAPHVRSCRTLRAICCGFLPELLPTGSGKCGFWEGGSKESGKTLYLELPALR